ncbi:hypothetical protein MKK70_09285 [Methylobacterium sp. E-041]|nr:hypothetical protein [Methylobacterium sp. E-041]MCJ2105568.1 hypothetical protein [Methylobacterium sp. E-041]
MATSSIGGILAARGSVLIDAFFVAVVVNVIAYIAAAAGLMPKRPNA